MSQTMTGENRFCFVAPMWNATRTVGQMLASICCQSYTNWRIILIDDKSDSSHCIHENEAINDWRDMVQPGWRTSAGDEPKQTKIDVIWNDTKQWETANVLKGISMCEDDDVICRIDADDYLTDLDALMYLNAFYNQTKADALWTAHRWGFTDKNISGPIPPDADPYVHPWVSSHLKTFRKRLINGVPYENFTNMNGDLVRRCGDQAVFLPCLHRATRRGYVPRVFYHYSIDEQDGKVYQTDDAHFQRDEADFIRKRGYVSLGQTWESVLHESSKTTSS
jgi:glycosyltransferase involved in cell wall biosynthesis